MFSYVTLFFILRLSIFLNIICLIDVPHIIILGNNVNDKRYIESQFKGQGHVIKFL